MPTYQSNKHSKLRLLPPEALLKTGPVDHADWNFRPVLGWIQRIRFGLVLSLIPKRKFSRMLEVGYGSGILMPELAARCEQLCGIDVHPMNQEVAVRLQEFHIKADLRCAGAEAIPYEDEYFDCVVAVSSLEFVSDQERACQELQRVLRPDGVLVLVTPGHSPLVDLGLKLLTGESAKADYGDRREMLRPTLSKYFSLDQKRQFPPLLGSLLCLYTALRLTRKPTLNL